jgi:hypothetical protein
MKELLIILCVSLLIAKHAQATDLSADVLVRYENETGQNNLAVRKRMRLIAALNLKHQFSQKWVFNAQARTGLKNKQNVPALTFHRFTEQNQPDNDIFISRLYTKASFDKLAVYAGKIPWKTHQVTDLFWDRDLNPIGLHLDYRLNSAYKLSFASFKPLDGATGTVGHMSILQLNTKLDTQFGTITLAPWFVNYQGQEGAEFAKRDTAQDNRFIRLSAALKSGKWQVGADLGRSIQQLSINVPTELANQKLSYTLELKHGNLKHTGSYLTQLKYLHVERFAVVSEFAQNASSRFATSNFKGWDLRIRHRLNKRSWIGARLSKTERLIGTPEQSLRFRIETKYSF